MTQFYTKRGDEGYTGLLGEGRVPKYHPRTEAFGDIDEASSAIGVARSTVTQPDTGEKLLKVQRDLYSIMAEVSATPENSKKFRTISNTHVDWLENEIHLITQIIEIPKEFIISGDSVSGAHLDLARTIVRRAERKVARLFHEGELENIEILRYLNRLSSFLFVLELLETGLQGKATPTLAKG
jgi:cob(I)alamin adenosyltransferase